MERLLRIGHAPTDTQRERQLKSAFGLVLVGLLIVGLDFLLLRDRTVLERTFDAALLGANSAALLALHVTKRCDVPYRLLLAIAVPGLASLLFVNGNREGDLLFFVLAPVGAVPLLGPHRSVPWFLICVASVAAVVLIQPLLPAWSSSWHASSLNPHGMLFHSPARVSIHFDHLITYIATVSLLYALVFMAYRALEHANQRIEELLFNVLPRSVATRLTERDLAQRPTAGAMLSDESSQATILFADIVGFTELASAESSARLLDILDQIFTEFDHIAERHRVEKIKTIGDAYMAVCGLPEPDENHARNIAETALDMVASMERLRHRTNVDLHIRIGINTGPVIAGIIGRKKFIYDLWGDAVNTASRMESHGEPDTIQVSVGTFEALADSYVFEPRGDIEVKGKGPLRAWRLIGRRS